MRLLPHHRILADLARYAIGEAPPAQVIRALVFHHEPEEPRSVRSVRPRQRTEPSEGATTKTGGPSNREFPASPSETRWPDLAHLAP